MKARYLALMTAVMASFSVAACATTEEDDSEGSEAAVSTRNLGRQDFGLQSHELVLTLDDGPGARTKELVDFFVAKKVPAVFFMVGKNAKANPDAVAYVASHSRDVPGGLIVANHSNTHTTPLPKQGVEGALGEIMKADGVLADNIKVSQEQFPKAVSFFRPPYGAFTSLGASNIQTINDRGAAKYVGPIFWEIGGELTDKYSADWACWGKVDIARCAQGYIAEAELRGKGLVLVHDVHAKTVDMLKGTAGSVGLIEALRAKGFKFVGLRAHDNGAEVDEPVAETATIRAESYPQADGTVEVQVEAAGAASVVVYFDQDEQGKKFSSPASGRVTGRRFAPGQHTIRIAALDSAGNVIGQKATNFIVSSEIENDSADASNSACVNYGNLARVRERGQYFDLFHKAIDCGAPDALQAAPGECFKYKGKLTVARMPQAIGAEEWTVEYDLSYEGAPTDKSKISMVLETGTGHIVTGKRHAFTDARRPEVALEETDVDCSKGIWHGDFLYANGTKEKFRFSKPGE